MNIPPARNAGTDGLEGKYWSSGCEGMACMWFSQGCSIGCPNCTENNKVFTKSLCGSKTPPTIRDPSRRTFNRHAPSGSVLDWTKTHPWRAPGSAPVLDPCGVAGGASKNNSGAGGFVPPSFKAGDKGSSLPALPTKTMWDAGSIVEVSWAIAANHGGGYQYRLCPKTEALTEECFKRMPLAFVGDKQVLRWKNGTEAEIPATRVSEGTVPSGSTWTMNPIPTCKGFISGGFHEMGCKGPLGGPQFPPPPGCDKTCWGYQPDPEAPWRSIPNIVDRVQIPGDLPDGEYVISWRWDCEHTPQVWNSCGDVTVARRPSLLV